MSTGKGVLTPLEKISVLLITLGQETTIEILKQMSEEDAELIAAAIAKVETVTTDQQDEVLREFEELLLSGKFVEEGGFGFAKAVLEGALGEAKAERVLQKLGRKTPNGFYMLRNVDPKQLNLYLSKEQPQTIALILSQVKPEQAAGVIDGLSQELRGEVAYKMAQLDEVAPEVLEELEERLADDMESILAGRTAEIGGVETVARILNAAAYSEDVLSQIEGWDPELSDAIRGEMFTFYDLVKLDDTEIQILLKNLTDKSELALALKGADQDSRVQELKDRILKNLSIRVRTDLEEEIEFMGEKRRTEVEQARKQILDIAMELDNKGQGEIKIIRATGEEYLR